MQLILIFLVFGLIIFAINPVINSILGGAAKTLGFFGRKTSEGIEIGFLSIVLVLAHAIERIYRFPILLAPLFIAVVWAFFAFVLPMLPKGSSHEYISEYAPHAPRAELVRLP
jgi:hypothetical protein